MARDGARIVAWACVLAGAAYFAAELGVLGGQAGNAALALLALVVIAYLTWTVDPAWLLSAGIVATMFAGQWEQLGLSQAIGPHRVLLAAGVLALLLRAPPARGRPPLRLDAVHFVLAAALAYAVISAIAVGTIDVRQSQLGLLDQYGLLPFVMFAVAPVAFATERQRMILLGTLVGTGAYLSITAVLEKLELYSLLVPSYIGYPWVGIHWGRARGPFVEAAANGLALYACAVAAVIALVLWRRPWPRALAAGVVVLAPVAVLLTVTRSVWLAAIAATVVALATTPAIRRFLVPAAAFGVAAVLTAFVVIPGLAQDAENRQNDKAPVYERQNTNSAALRMVADRPFFGFGWDTANFYMGPYFRLDPDIPLTGQQAGLHNSYLWYAVNLGLLGLALWLVAIGLAFGRALTSRAPPSVEPWRIGLKAIVLAWLAVGLLSPGHYPFTTLLVWTWAGLVYRRPAEAPVRVPAWLSGNGRAGQVATVPR